MRNKALEPLWGDQGNGKTAAGGAQGWLADRIIYMNDVFVCARDFIRLMLHSEDMVCALDFWQRNKVDACIDGGTTCQESNHMRCCCNNGSRYILSVLQKWASHSPVRC